MEPALRAAAPRLSEARLAEAGTLTSTEAIVHVDLYRAVLMEAASPQDLYAYLDEPVLRRLWARLWLRGLSRRLPSLIARAGGW